VNARYNHYKDEIKQKQYTYLKYGLKVNPRTSTTSFLTATTLIYAIGAGITAAAGTRLALQLILDKGFKLFSFQLQKAKPSALLFFVTTSLS
jgi:hypothetical protein